jgi:HAD superfamily hydrolase (TIGR01509 family)
MAPEGDPISNVAPPRGAIWDMDGVIVDSEHHHLAAWQATFAARGRRVTPEEFRATFGMTNDRAIEALIGPVDQATLDAVAAEKEERFRAGFRENPTLVNGALRLAERLAATGIRQAIASSAPTENIDLVWDLFDLDRFFVCAVSGVGLPSKPNPDVFEEAARRLGLPPAECVVFEDAFAGIAGARAAGMRVVAVATTHDAADLSAADLVVPDLSEVDLTRL